MRALLALALTISLPQLAAAGDWRYCLAPSHAEHKTYISPAFPATTSMDDAESEFGRTLRRSGAHFDDVQCPRADDRSTMLIMQQHAIDVNHELGNRVINLRWKPAG